MDDSPEHIVTGAPSSPASHAARPTVRPSRLVVATVALGAAVLGAVAVGLRATSAGPVSGPPPSARQITATPTMPLPPADLAALAGRPPQAGPLTEPAALAACLRGLGRPGVPVLGASTATVDGRAAVVLLLPGPDAGEFRAVAVRADCDAARSGLLVEEVLPRP